MTSSQHTRGVPALADASRARAEAVAIDFPACIAAEFPVEFDPAWRAVEATLQAIAGHDLSPLARRSPGLAGYDWTSYLTCSVARMVRALAIVRAHLPPGSRVLDYGAYFGNFARMLRNAGYAVTAADAYGESAGVFDPVTAGLREAGVRVLDTTEEHLAADGNLYDAVLLMGVVEHVPHTPRHFLESVDRLLRAGGWLILDTPNLAYLYTRQRLLRGESIFCPLALQYYTEIPFEGHHREYTVAEVEWMLHALGHADIRIETFNYSFYGLTELSGADLDNHRQMLADPALREVIMAASRKPSPPA